MSFQHTTLSILTSVSRTSNDLQLPKSFEVNKNDLVHGLLAKTGVEILRRTFYTGQGLTIQKLAHERMRMHS
jgi:hypothetical protein